MIEQANQQIEKDVRDILKQVGDDPERAGVLETPQRVAKMYGEVWRIKEKPSLKTISCSKLKRPTMIRW